MAAAGESGRPPGFIRPLDPFRDLEDVVELIGLAFGDRLDPTGRATLERMRRFARSGPFGQWMWALLGKSATAPGFVWVVDGEVVGNVSLRRARRQAGYLVGNVVVRPDYRGRGIARTLMRRTISVLSRRSVPWVGLEVRTDNDAARRLYDGMGFREVGRTYHLTREISDAVRNAGSAAIPLRRGGRRDAAALVALFRRVVPAEQRPLVERSSADYSISWERRVDHWLRCEDEVWWIAPAGTQISGAVRVLRKPRQFPDRIEVLLSPEATDELASALVRQGLVGLRRYSRKVVESAVPDPGGPLLTALRREGFRDVRVLIQMKLDLRQKISVRSPRTLD